jgi:hypothetical protein
MTELPTRTPAQVQQSRTNASTRRVATRRRRTGHSTSPTRMAPWRNQGASWEELKAVEASLDTAERKKLDRLTDMELFRRALREITIAHLAISRAVGRRIPIAPITELLKLAVLIQQLAESYEIIVEGWNLYDKRFRLKGNAPVRTPG